MRYFPILLVCFCVLGLVTLAVSQSEEENNNVITSDFGRRVITNVRGGNRRRSIMTENPLLAVQDKNIKEPADQMALEQQYYIEPVTPTTSTVKPTFRRRKTQITQRPTSLDQQKKKEGPSDGNNNDGNVNPQEHFNPFKQVVNTSFSKRRPSGGRPRARAQNNEISSTTEGQEQKSNKIRFSVSQEIDHNNEGNNPSAFGLRGQAFRGDAGEDKPRFRPSQQGKSNFRSNRVPTSTRRTFPDGTPQSDKSPLEITYENETAGNENQNAGRRKFILRPRQQSTGRPSGFSPATTSETPARQQRKRKRPSFLHDSENLESNAPLVIAAPENVPRARSIDGGQRRRKTTSFTPPTQRFSASELVINAELLPSPSPFVLVSVSPLHSENKNQIRRRQQQKPGLKPVTGDYDFFRTTTGYTTDSSATISTFPTTVVTDIENVIITDSEPIIILPPVSSTVQPQPKPVRRIKQIPGRDRINERLRISRDRNVVNPTPGVPVLQASASTTVQVVSPSPQAPLEVPQGQEGAKQNLFPTRQTLFDKLNRKQATLKLLSPKPKVDKPVEQVNIVESKKNAPPRKITSLTQQNLRRRVPGSGVLNRKLQKEIASENPPPEGENTSSEVSEEQSEKNVAENPPPPPAVVSSPSPPVGIRNLTNRRRPMAMKQILVAAPVTPNSHVKENVNETQDAPAPPPNPEGETEGQHPETPVASPLLSKVRKLPTRAPLLHRLVITTAAPPPAGAEEAPTVNCAANQRYSKFLKRCVTQYNPAKNLGLH